MTRAVKAPGSNDRSCSRLQPLTTPQTGHELNPTHQKLSSCLRHNRSRHLGARCALPAAVARAVLRALLHGEAPRLPTTLGPPALGQRPDLGQQGFARQGECDPALAVGALSERLRGWRHSLLPAASSQAATCART